MNRRKNSVVLVVFGTCVGLFASLILGPAALASPTPQPVWRIHAISYPTRFEAGSQGDEEQGPGYVVFAENVGAAPTSGTFVIAASLPSGIAPSFKGGVSGRYGSEANPTAFACSATNKAVSCTSGTELLYPGQVAEIVIPVEVSPKVSGTPMVGFHVEGGSAPAASTALVTQISSESPPFDFLDDPSGLYGGASAVDGSAVTQAGSHPYQLTIGMGFNVVGAKELSDTNRVPGGGVRRISATLPRGVVVDPGAAPKCSEAVFESGGDGSKLDRPCPPSTQVGILTLPVSLSASHPTVSPLPVYNLAPPPGVAGALGVEVIQGVYVHLLGHLSSDGLYRIAADVINTPATVGVIGSELTLWGEPADPSHDHVRGVCAVQDPPTGEKGERCSAAPSNRALVSLPSSCAPEPLGADLTIENWLGKAVSASLPFTDLAGKAEVVDGCGNLNFSPTATAQPTTNVSDSPSGLDFDLHIPQDFAYEGLAEANLRDTTVKLPVGLTVNPSAANGLGACGEAQIDLHQDTPSACPGDSKLGTVEVSTSLIEHPLHGSIYLASPHANPFGTLLALYLAIEDPSPGSGVVIKLPGRVEADWSTGQLTATFQENPELPFEDLVLHFFDGPRASLTTPLSCGEYTTESLLTPWSTPEGQALSSSNSFTTGAAASGGDCPSGEAAAPRGFSFTAGTESPLAGIYSPFVLHLSRKDGFQHIAGIETTLPEGLVGKLAGVAYCPESGIAEAKSREAPEEGKEEIVSPSCPASSELGTVNVTAGSGTSPFPVSGHAYLAGPYKGAPLSMVVIVPAVAGPFDLGTVVDRVALKVGEYDARVHAVADPLPTVRDGIPLDVRSIEVKLGRPGFTLNPTSCEAKAVEASITTQTGQVTPLNNRFQVGDCGTLAFKPKFSLSLKGPTKRTGHPSLRAEVVYPKGSGYANIARAQVSLPHSEFLDQGNIGKACTKVLLAAAACPAKSVYGKVRAWTSLLEKPLEGPVYLVGGYGYKLPALVAELNGQIRVLLVGKVDTDKQKGIRNTFEAVPDAPVEKFVLVMKGGKKYGLLENSENICRKTQKAGVAFTAQNGRVKSLTVKILNSCKGGHAVRKRHPRKHNQN